MNGCGGEAICRSHRRPPRAAPPPASGGVPPDLIAIFGDLYWRSAGSVGGGQVWTRENDTGPDDANHAQHGMFVATGLSLAPGERDPRLLDIAPLIARDFGLAEAVCGAATLWE